MLGIYAKIMNVGTTVRMPFSDGERFLEGWV
jgi:hypothetical protein